MPLAPVLNVIAGCVDTCVLWSNSSLRCIGVNLRGELGTGDTSSTYVSPPTDAATGVSMVAGGLYYFCALMATTQGVRCWGSADGGTLGNGMSVGAVLSVPAQDVITGVLAVQTGTQHTCVIMAATYGLRCWGQGNSGQLGNSAMIMVPTPPIADVLAGPVAQMALGQAHTCVMLANYTVRCWGANNAGQCAVASTIPNVITPPSADLISGVASIGTGPAANHVCVIMQATAGVRCWGKNNQGQAGVPTSTASVFSVPTVDLITGVAQVALGAMHTCVRMIANGGVRCWGDNSQGALGIGTSTGPVPVVPSLDTVIGYAQLSLGALFSCGIYEATGGVRCWGNL